MPKLRSLLLRIKCYWCKALGRDFDDDYRGQPWKIVRCQVLNKGTMGITLPHFGIGVMTPVLALRIPEKGDFNVLVPLELFFSTEPGKDVPMEVLESAVFSDRFQIRPRPQ